jgi:hypothetical protein
MTTQTDPNANADATSNGTVTTGALETLVGEGKKFKTPEDLAKGKIESDSFIRKVTGENSELKNIIRQLEAEKEELARKAAFVRGVTSEDGDTSNGDGNPGTPKPDTSKANQPASLGAEDVIKLMDERELNKQKNANLRQVDTALAKEYGAEAKNFVVAKAAELGVSTEFLTITAQQSPAAFFNLIGFQPNQPRNPSLTSRVNGATVGGVKGSTNLRDAKFYEDLKAKMGNTKFVMDTNLQIQLHKDMEALGDRFFG